jgi:uncharacterized protein
MSSEPLFWMILKVSQHCNLNCSYCYVYNRGDDSWKTRPPVIREAVVHAIAEKIEKHCAAHEVERFTIELHGGEPLLIGKRRMQNLITSFRQTCTSARLDFVLQTNGLLLDREWLDLFETNHVRFGVSLDGPPSPAGERRVFRNGRGSTQRLLTVIAKLRREDTRFDRLGGGILCVIDPASNGATMIDWFLEQGFGSLDFLLPDGNYVNLPEGWNGPEPYLRFLLEAFDRWYALGEGAPEIRMFEVMMMGLMGATPTLDAFGGDLKQLCVVESDGSIGVNDTMRFCGADYARDKLNVFEHDLDTHREVYQIDEIQRPCATCRACPFFSACHGGYLPHRFDGASFDNPSLYCDALYGLSQRMVEVLSRDLPRSVVERATVVQLQ